MVDTSRSQIEDTISRRNLSLLTRMRWIAIAGQLGAVLTTEFWLGIDLPLPPMFLLLGLLTVMNLFSHWRLGSDAPITSTVPFTEIMLDVTALAGLLYLSGGATNPFSGLFLLQIVTAATLLPPLESGPVFMLVLGAQLILLNHGVPLKLPMDHTGSPNAFNLHLQGMFLSFVLTAGLAIWFILGIRDNLRRRDERLAELRQQVEDEQVVLRLGLLASSAAHDLGTPLTNLAVILDDWQDLGLPEQDELLHQAKLMQEAVATCRDSLSCMLRDAGQARTEALGRLDAVAFARSVAARWQEGKPGLQIEVKGADRAPGQIVADPLLARALENLLDNAREAGSARIRLGIEAGGAGTARIVVHDDGPGFPKALIEAGPAGQIATVADRSRGLGLFLVQAVLRRMGGRLALDNPAGGGARATLTLPAIPA